MSSTTVQRWKRSPSLLAGAAAALVLAATGLIAARVDIALLALPLVVAVAMSWDRRPVADDEGTASLHLGQAGDTEISYRLDIRPPRHVAAIRLRYSVLRGQSRELVLAAHPTIELSGTVPILHSGPQEFVRLEHRFLTPGAGYLSLPEDPIVGERVIAPSQTMIRSLPLPRRLQGTVGGHESARAGDGGEFRDIHLFTAGDRLRRIDWKTTARRGQNLGDLYVRRTNALADISVLIVMDSRDDVGEQVAAWNRSDAAEKGISSLDVAREAASSVAAAYIAAGDRVGFQDLSSRARLVTHASGSRHLWRLLRAIEITSPAAVSFRHDRAPIVPSGALVYLLSSFLDDQPVKLALTWLGHGHRVIAVDVLPPARFARTTRYDRIAHRMVIMERDDRIRVMGRRGVELLRWREEHGGLPPAARLALLSRPARRLGSAGTER